MNLRKPVALLPLQIFFYADTIYSWIYLFLQLALFVYRGYTLNYTITIIGLEVFGVFLLFCIQMVRIFIGSVGNKTEEISPLLYMILATIPTAIGAIYYLRLQNYVLIADIILNIGLLGFMVLELIFALFAIIRFKSSEKNQ